MIDNRCEGDFPSDWHETTLDFYPILIRISTDYDLFVIGIGWPFVLIIEWRKLWFSPSSDIHSQPCDRIRGSDGQWSPCATLLGDTTALRCHSYASRWVLRHTARAISVVKMSPTPCATLTRGRGLQFRTEGARKASSESASCDNWREGCHQLPRRVTSIALESARSVSSLHSFVSSISVKWRGVSFAGIGDLVIEQNHLTA